MKKLLSIILATVCLIVVAAPCVYADDAVLYSSVEENTYTEYYDDGSYMVTTIREYATPRATTYTKTAEKIANLYNSSDELQWTYKLIGTFTVESGVSSVCTNSTYSCNIVASGWSLTAHDNSYSGNEAYGTATLKKKVLFITVQTSEVDMKMRCDANGVIS